MKKESKEINETIYTFSDFSNRTSDIKLIKTGIITLIEHTMMYCKRPEILITSQLDDFHTIQYKVIYEKVKLRYRLRIYFSNSLFILKNKVFDEAATKKNVMKAIDLLKMMSFRDNDSYRVTLYNRKDEEYFESFYYKLRNLCKD